MHTITEQQAESMADFVAYWTRDNPRDLLARAEAQSDWCIMNDLPCQVQDETGFIYGLPSDQLLEHWGV